MCDPVWVSPVFDCVWISPVVDTVWVSPVFDPVWVSPVFDCVWVSPVFDTVWVSPVFDSVWVSPVSAPSSVRVRFGSPVSSKGVVHGQFVETLKWLSSLPTLTQESFCW